MTYGVEARFGFMEDMNVERVIEYLRDTAALPGPLSTAISSKPAATKFGSIENTPLL